jgi:ACS family allantoate permease-like MFS transporter
MDSGIQISQVPTTSTRRNRIPWIVITISYFLCPVILLIIRFRLSRENKKRDLEPKVEEAEDAYIEEVLEDGTKVERRIDKVG